MLLAYAATWSSNCPNNKSLCSEIMSRCHYTLAKVLESRAYENYWLCLVNGDALTFKHYDNMNWNSPPVQLAEQQDTLMIGDAEQEIPEDIQENLDNFI